MTTARIIAHHVGRHPDDPGVVAAAAEIEGEQELLHRHAADLVAERDALAAKVARVGDLADEWERDEAYACHRPTECLRCVSFQRAVIRLRAALADEAGQP